MKVINATPHDVKIIIGEKEIVIPKTGITIRIKMEEKQVGQINIDGIEIPIVKNIPAGIEFIKNGNPMTEEEIKDTFKDVEMIITPAMISSNPEAIKEIKKIIENEKVMIVSPNTNKAIRNNEGKIVGVPSFTVFV